MSNVENIAIVGAGQAAASAIAKLRALGYDGKLSLIGDEPFLPYQRPPLSKKYLMGHMEADNLLLKPKQFYDDHHVDVRLGLAVDAIDTQEQSLRLTDGDQISWDRLLLATGAQPRQLASQFIDAFGAIYTMRTLHDVDHLAHHFVAGKRLLVVGGGYIGLEAAAVARHFGVETTLIEAAPRILQRVAAPETAAMFCELHRQNGVDLREGVLLTDLKPGHHNDCIVSLNDGSEVTVDFIIVGIGVEPVTGEAEAAGLTVDRGIVVNAFCQTSNPLIFAAGDCASLPWKGQQIRLESVQNAIAQGEAAAQNMLGANKAYEPLPWFWSDQYDVKLQIAGLNHGYDKTVVRTGAREGARSVWYYRADALLACDAFNDAGAFMTAKNLLAKGLSPSPDLISNPDTDLKSLLKR